MTRQIDRLYHKALAKRRGGASWFDKVLNKIVYIRDNADTQNPELNGEYALIHRVMPLLKSHNYVDVGAALGDHSRYVRSVDQSAKLFLYDINPNNINVLHERFKLDPRAFVADYGLSDGNGSRRAMLYPGHSFVSSFHGLPWGGGSEVNVDIRSAGKELESIVQQHGRIGILKLDIEGHEMTILRDIASILHEIEIIQFEYNLNWIVAKETLGAAYELLSPHFYIGKLYQNGVDFRDYDIFRDERFIASNWVAIAKILDHVRDAVAL